MVSGAVSLAASAAMWNPLPLILWGLGSTGWVLFASTSKALQKQVLEDEARAKEAQVEAEREVLRQKVEVSLNEPQVAVWIRRGTIPDYMQAYRRLVELRDRVAKLLRERSASEAFSDEGILDQLNYMLTAYLSFVRERLVYLYILVNLRAGPDGEAASAAGPAGAGKSATPPPPPPPAGFAANRWERVARPKTPAKAAPEPSPSAPPSVDQRLAEIDGKIQRLKDLAEKEPATAKTREWHVDILEKQRDLLLECQKRDQCVVAQLGAFLDVFEVILARVSASQFSATEIASYMGSVVRQIEETERFVASMQPAMNELIGGLEPGLNRWPAST